MMPDEELAPAPTRLFTWVDVDQHFAALAALGQWPDWLREVDAYWDGVEFTVAAGTDPGIVWTWLMGRLGLLTVDIERPAILLESTSDGGRPLDVRLRFDDEWVDVTRQPRWNEPRVVQKLAESLPVPVEDAFPYDVRVCAFHSFKGGVGRTLHSVALACELAARAADHPAGKRVLLVDADMEAPGISWMVASGGDRLDFAFDDFVALLHGSTGDGDEAIGLARKFLLNQERDGVVVLPTTRDPMRVGPPRIEPVDLLSHHRSPYLLTESLARLAHAVGANTVVIDLRAGTSELNAPVLLDPRVQRVFVTTISDQSVQGTVHLLDTLGHRAPSSRTTHPVCAVLVTQFQEKEHSAEFTEVAHALKGAITRTIAGSTLEMDTTDTTTDQDVITEPLSSPFLSPLLALPGGWNEVCGRIEQTSLRSVVADLADALRPQVQETPSPATVADGDLSTQRRRLAETAGRLVFAETAEGQSDFLPTEALVSLVLAHRTEAPVEVVVGAKGSGKTFTYLRMCRTGTWKAFGRATDVSDIELTAPLVPVLASRYLAPELADEIAGIQRASADHLSGSEPASSLTIRDIITEALGQDMSDIGWRHTWLACLARAAGLNATPDTAEQVLTELARTRQVVFVIDGLEDLFQDFSNDPHQQQALRALLTGCPEWLRSLRGRPLGLVVFVRRDLVLNSIRQNVQQFLGRHRPYELRWNRVEALRLAAWVCQRAGVLTYDAPVRTAKVDELSKLLLRLWGLKLGSNASREARSEEWFLAALSDFNLQIQARDIVSFLSVAAEESATDTRWTDRLLAPAAMRRALPQCSRDKISAIEQENTPVREVFEHLRGLPEERRKAPFTLESVGLSQEQARLLEANGVLFREHDQYWIPEIYRHGLGFGASKVGRPRVVSITQLIRNRGGSG